MRHFLTVLILCLCPLTLPAQTGSGGAAKSIKWSTVSTSTTAAVLGGYKVTSAGITLTLPTGTKTGQTVTVLSTLTVGASFTIAPAASQSVLGNSLGVLCDVPNAGLTLVYFADSQDWRVF